jgi:hypothetical protein
METEALCLNEWPQSLRVPTSITAFDPQEVDKMNTMAGVYNASMNNLVTYNTVRHFRGKLIFCFIFFN